MSEMMETDNNGDVRRGATQIKLSGHKFISDKSCKERIKKLSAVNKVSGRNEEKYEMACVVADREESSRHSQSPSPSDAPSKKFKLPKKQFFDDFNGVDHVSVPRKLRSAMKKRNGESSSSLFPDSKKLNYSSGGVKSVKKVDGKRSKLNLKQGGPSWSLQQSEGPITKDEEEVVETLYALAGMFPDCETDNRSKTGNASLDASALVLTGPSYSLAHKLEEALEEDVNAHCLSKIDEAVGPADDRERLPENTVEACSLGGPSIHIVSNFSKSEKLHGLDSSIVHVQMNKMLKMHEEQKPRGILVNFCFPLEPYQDNGKVKQPVIGETSLLETKPDTALGLTTPLGQLKQHSMTNEPNRNDSWAGFSSTLTSTSHGPLSRSCSAKVPAWFATSPGSLETDSSTGTELKVPVDRRSHKKCASHIYISQLIKSLQTPETKESLELLPNKPQEILKRGVYMPTNDFNCVKTELNRVKSPTSIVETTKTNLYDSNSGNLQHLKLQKEHPHADLASGAYTSPKQSFNFLSLSAGGGNRTESSISYNNRVESQPESMATLQIPYQAQNLALVPFSMYQTRATSAYPLPPSAAAVNQAQPQLHPALKQQQLWASQVAQYRNIGTSTAMAHFPSLQNGRRQGSPAMVQCMAPLPMNVEPLGPKYPHVSRHHQLQYQQQNRYQHQQYVGFSLEHGRLKRQDHHLSSVFDDTELRFRAGGGPLPMQLLCNEHL